MAMYTALFGKIQLRPEFACVIRVSEWGGLEFDWGRLQQARQLRNHPDVKAFLQDPRYTSLDCVSSTYFNDYAFDDYIDLPQLEEGSPRPLVYDPGSRMVSLCTTLVNYTDTITKFLRLLPLIAEHWELYEIYEEAKWDQEPTRHQAKNETKVTHGYQLR